MGRLNLGIRKRNKKGVCKRKKNMSNTLMKLRKIVKVQANNEIRIDVVDLEEKGVSKYDIYLQIWD